MSRVEPKESPILFSGPLVRKILADEKDVTRRLLRGDPETARPYANAGERLWVRETWQAVHFSPCFENPSICDDFWVAKKIPKSSEGGYWTAAHAADPQWPEHPDDRGFSWRPSIHMPRWASRITLEVVSVRAERLHDITPEDALREGITIPTGPTCPCETEVEDPGPHLPHCEWRHLDLDPDYYAREVIEFACLWDSLNSARGFGWATNPRVWRVEFRRVEV